MPLACPPNEVSVRRIRLQAKLMFSFDFDGVDNKVIQ